MRSSAGWAKSEVGNEKKKIVVKNDDLRMSKPRVREIRQKVR
jgi:hypothetical protein